MHLDCVSSTISKVLNLKSVKDITQTEIQNVNTIRFNLIIIQEE